MEVGKYKLTIHLQHENIEDLKHFLEALKTSKQIFQYNIENMTKKK